jgi:hypothetical protein
MRVTYFYALTPLVVVAGTGVLLTSPFLALIALMIVVLSALAALTWAIVSASLFLSRAISHGWHGRSGTSPRMAAALSPTTSVVRRTRSVPAGETVLLTGPPSERHM